MKRTITGMLALATMVVGLSAFKSADAKTVTSADSIAVTVDSLAATDSLVRVDSLVTTDSLVRVDSLVATDSLVRVDSLVAMDSLARNVDSVKGIDSLRAVEGGSITGKISPADGATEVEAANGDEKLKGAVAEGSFAIPAAKAGTYTITVLAKAPYKNAIIKDVKVEDGKATDLGEIKLEQ